MSDDLVKRLRATCSCNIDNTPCLAEEECRVAQEAADRIKELEAKLAKAVEAKLAKAVEALEEAIYLLDPEEEDIAKETGIYRVGFRHAEN